MRILINDFERYRSEYINIFKAFGYEENELIFCQGFSRTKEFIVDQLEGKKLHIDLMITNDSSTNYQFDLLQSSKLAFFKNSLTSSFSKQNFRISSIPLILYSQNESRQNRSSSEFHGIIQKNSSGNHKYFINKCETAIKEWRKDVLDDLDFLEIPIENLATFTLSKYFLTHYAKRILNSPEYHFSHNTKVLSTEFIKYPKSLDYDWLKIKGAQIEEALDKYSNMYKFHLKYDRKNNERNVLHRFFNDYKIVLLRDVFSDLLYETNLYETNGIFSEECDYILRTDYPGYLNTTLFEVKKEDVKFFSNKKRKRPSLNRKFQDHLDQLWQYKKYVMNPENSTELEYKLGYRTNKFDYVLLAGRFEEKAEFRELFQDKIQDHYNGITVLTYEELEEANSNYLNKFTRLKSIF